MGAGGDVAEVQTAVRRIEKATLVSIRLDDRPGVGALMKHGFVHALALQPGDTERLREAQALDQDAMARVADLLPQFEGDRPPSRLPLPTVFADVPGDDLLRLGHELARLRAEDDAADPVRLRANQQGLAAGAGNLANAARVAVRAFEANISASPIGMLNLERIEMYPAGIERGALLATIPLAPKEKTSVVHKEWSVTTQEFTSIVTDSLEDVSETGVTDNTELSQSTGSQVQHGNQFNVNGTVSGTFGLVTTSSSAGFTAQSSESASAAESRKHAVSVTRKASSRVNREHKVTISTRTETGTSETSTREIENPSETDAIRIDYFGLMRKWNVGLYRYGLRLTYDITIPEPGAAMRRRLAELDTLRDELDRPFVFGVKPGEITKDSYRGLEDRWGVVVPHYPYPDFIAPLMPNRTIDVPEQGWSFHPLEFDIPPGHVVRDVFLNAFIGEIADHDIDFNLMGSNRVYPNRSGNLGIENARVLMPGLPDDPADQDPFHVFLRGATGHQTVTFFAADADRGWAGLTVWLDPEPSRIEDWRNAVWSALHDGAQAAHYARQQELAGRIRAIEDELAAVDTLTLRREEHEEVMKGVLRWILGPTFDFMPDEVVDLFRAQKILDHGVDLEHGVAFTGNEVGLSANGWRSLFLYEEMVKFVNEAIEWENLLYFLYPYFWDVPVSWDFVRAIRHPDATRQAFLRAGSARVVLPVRRGWEEAWVSFVENGGFGKTLLPEHPYVSIAREIEEYDRTNYPGIAPANPAAAEPADTVANVATVAGRGVPSGEEVPLVVASSDGFRPGAVVVVDDHASGVQEQAHVVSVPDGTTIVVDRLVSGHDTVPFPVVQVGEQGQLIAQWFEYTPTSGTDIQVSSPLTDMA